MTDHEKSQMDLSPSSPRSPNFENSKKPSDAFDTTDEESRQTLKKGHEPESAADVPPDGGYGWVVILSVFIINFHSWGINSTYGVFLAYYLSNNIFPGATYLEFAFIGGLSIGIALLVAPIATNVTRLTSTRVSLGVGTVLESVALITAGSCTKIWQLFLSQGICFGTGMGFLFVASAGLPPQWFSKRRSLANGIAAAGSGIGALTYALAANRILHTLGFPWALRILGIVAFIANTFATIIARDRNSQVGTATTVGFDWRLFKRWEFVLLQGWGFFFILGYVAVLFSLSNYAKSVIGLSADQASILSAVLNLGQGLGRPPIGYFSDTFGRFNMAISMTLLSGIFIFALWIPANSYAVLIVYALLGGAVLGTFWATVAVISAEVMGLADLSSALTVTWVVLSIPSICSEPIALEIAQRAPAKYLGAQVFAGIMYIVSGLMLIPVRAWKIRQVEKVAHEKSIRAGEDMSNTDRALTPWVKAMLSFRRA